MSVKMTSNWLAIFIALLSGSNALTIVEVVIPTAVRTLDTVTLHCKYDLEGEPLYTVKWYQGLNEFFRFIPKEHPNMLTFPTSQGLDVDLTKSSANKVVLRNVRPEMSGKYICEVSTDSPNFYTKKQSSFMYIVDVPLEDPIMIIEKGPLQVGYTIRGNCSSPPSFPPANVTWYLNDKKINSSTKTYLDPVAITSATTTTVKAMKSRRMPKITTASLELEIDDNTFTRGRARLKCVASLFNLYRKEKEEMLFEENPHPRPSSVFGIRDSASGRLFSRTDTLLIIIAFLSISTTLR